MPVSHPSATPTRTTERRSASFGEMPRELLARELHMPDLLILYGKLYVDEERVGKSGKRYRFVTLAFRDDLGEECRLKKVYFDGQCYHANVFQPYNEKTVLVCVGEIDTEQVEVVRHKDGKRNIYTYKVGELFLLSLNALRPEAQAPRPEPAPPVVAAPVPVPDPVPPAVAQTLAPAEPASWDADLPDEALSKPAEPTPAGVMTPAQLALEQQRYWADVANGIPNALERKTFLELHGISHDFQRWTEKQLPGISALLQCWFDVISEDHPLGHNNWDQPILPKQKAEMLDIAKRWPNERDGRLVIKELLTKRGYTLLREMTQGEIECLRLEVLADPRCPAPKAHMEK